MALAEFKRFKNYRGCTLVSCVCNYGGPTHCRRAAQRAEIRAEVQRNNASVHHLLATFCQNWAGVGKTWPIQSLADIGVQLGQRHVGRTLPQELSCPTSANVGKMLAQNWPKSANGECTKLWPKSWPTSANKWHTSAKFFECGPNICLRSIFFDNCWARHDGKRSFLRPRRLFEQAGFRNYACVVVVVSVGGNGCGGGGGGTDGSTQGSFAMNATVESVSCAKALLSRPPLKRRLCLSHATRPPLPRSPFKCERLKRL